MLPIEDQRWRRVAFKQKGMDQELLGAGWARQRDGSQLANQVELRRGEPELLFQFGPRLCKWVSGGFHVSGDDTPQPAAGRYALTAPRQADLPTAAHDGEHNLDAIREAVHYSERLVGYPEVMARVAFEIATLALIQNLAQRELARHKHERLALSIQFGPCHRYD